jgi:glycosyltransferase involved in cell wall biosynthesis
VAGRIIRVCAVRQFPFDTHLRREVDALLDAGHEVDVVCMSGDGRPRRERRGRLTIWRMPVQHRRGGRGRYVVEHAAFVTAAALTVAALHVRRRFDVVQVNSPPDSVVLAALVPKLTGTPLLLDLVESTPEFFATRFSTPDTHPVARLLAGVEQRAIRFADHAITGTRHMRERFAARGADATRIDVVLNASDERFFDPALAPPASESADDAFTLICHGSIEPRYGLDTAIRAVALLAGEIPELRFEIYGEGSARPELERLARELGVDDRVRFHGFVGIDELVAALARADAGLVAVKRDPFRDLTHTNKMFDFVAMRRPAIVSWTQSVADYFDEEALEYFRSDDPDDLARAIREVRRDPRRRQAMVRRAGELYEAYRWPRQREIYVAAVEKLASSRIGRVSTRKPA